MAKLTNAQLLSELTALRVDRENLSLALHNVTEQRDFLLADRNRLVDEVAEMVAAATPAPRTTRPVYVPRQPDAAQVAFLELRRAQMAHAKAEAMRTGRSVRVG